MLGIFKKKELPLSKGRFTSYGIEEIYDYIGKNRFEKRIEELKDVPTMGITLKEFVNSEIEYSSQELLSVLGTIIDAYFPNDLDIILFIYEYSKRYTESNYYTFPKTKMMFEERLRLMEMMAKRHPENEQHWKTEMIPKYWIDFHFFYSTLIKSLRQIDRKSKINECDI